LQERHIGRQRWSGFDQVYSRDFKKPEFIGKIMFIQNYDMNLAKMMLQGVDIWMNTPTRPLEASGTSGEKGVMKGTVHFSVLDGAGG
jgi:glucan phosphorylase